MAERRLKLSVDALGGQGDGVAAGPDGSPVYIPYALPGEAVEVTVVRRARGSVFAELRSVEERSPHRVAPPCPHFGLCGGCALQHLAPLPYGAWKRDKLVRALNSRGIDAAPVEEEERRLLYVSRILIPLVQFAVPALDIIPGLIAAKHIRIPVLKHFRLYGFFDHSVDFFAGRPNISQIDRFIIFI